MLFQYINKEEFLNGFSKIAENPASVAPHSQPSDLRGAASAVLDSASGKNDGEFLIDALKSAWKGTKNFVHGARETAKDAYEGYEPLLPNSMRSPVPETYHEPRRTLPGGMPMPTGDAGKPITPEQKITWNFIPETPLAKNFDAGSGTFKQIGRAHV